MAAVAGGRPLGGLEDAPSGCQGPAKSDGGPSIFLLAVCRVAEWSTVDTPGVEGGVLISRVTSPSNTPSLVSWCGPRMQRSSGSGSGRATCRCRLWPPGRQGDGRGRETLSVATDCVPKHPALPAGGQDSLPSLFEFGRELGNLKDGTSHSYEVPLLSHLQALCKQPALLHSVCTLQVCVRVVCLVPASMHPQIPAYSWVFERPVLAPSEDCQAVRCGNAGKLGGRDREKEVDGHRKKECNAVTGAPRFDS